MRSKPAKKITKQRKRNLTTEEKPFDCYKVDVSPEGVEGTFIATACRPHKSVSLEQALVVVNTNVVKLAKSMADFEARMDRKMALMDAALATLLKRKRAVPISLSSGKASL